MPQKIYSSSLSRQSSETKPSTKFVLVSQEPICFISNLTSPINKMFMRLIYLKNSTFLSLKITVDTQIDVRNETSKHHFLKSVKINKLTLLSVRMFQSVSGHNSEESIAHYRSRPTVLQLKGISDTISN